MASANAVPAASFADDPDVITVEGDDFVALARRHGIPFSVLASANPDLDPFALEPASTVILPLASLTPEGLPPSGPGIVINLAELRLYHRDDGDRLSVYPIGIGRSGNDTPLANTVVTRTEADPSWRPPASIHAEYREQGMALAAVVPPGPDNPLGTHAVRLALPGYLLHGTNAPDGVGLRVSHGCIRLYNDDIAALAANVAPGTPVAIVHQPIKWTLQSDTVLLEAHRPLAGARYGGGRAVRESLDALRSAIQVAGLDGRHFDAELSARHARDSLFSGRVLRLPLARIRPPSTL